MAGSRSVVERYRTWSLEAPAHAQAIEMTTWPKPPGDDRILVAAQFAGLCETDYKIWQGIAANPLVRYPIVLGHEWTGRVVKDPRGRVAPGQSVVIEGMTPCRRCRACNLGRSNWCETPEHSGVTYNGGFAPWSWVPRTAAHPVSPRDHPEAFVFVEPAASVMRAVEAIQSGSPRTVLVLGLGSIGRLAVLLLQDLLNRVAIRTYDPIPQRHRWAGEHGALPVDTVQAESADRVIECSGTIEGFHLALQAVRPGGTVALEGVPPGEATATVRPALFHRKEITVRGIYSSTMQSFQQSLDWVAQREQELAALLDGPYAAEALPQLMDRLARGQTRGKLYIAWDPTVWSRAAP